MNISMSKYEEYMDDYLNEETDIMDKYLVEEKVSTDTYVFRDNIIKTSMAKVLASSANRESVVSYTGEFMDKNSEQLQMPGPVKIFTFTDKDSSFFYELFESSKERMLQLFNRVINEAYGGTLSKPLLGLITSAPHKILITAMLVHSLEKGYKDLVTCSSYLMAFTEYPLVYRKFWTIDAQEGIMRFTMEHLPNDFKSKSKSLTNLISLLKYDIDKVVALCTDRLKTNLDYQYIDFIYRYRNQIKGTFKSISREYYKNWEKNSTQHTNITHHDDGELANQEGHSSNIGAAVEQAYGKILTNSINHRLIGIVAEANQVDRANLTTYLNKIFAAKNNKLYRFIENIITIYFSQNPTNTSVSSEEFINFGLVLYRRISGSKNPLHQEVRQILDLWMNDIIDIRKDYGRDGTVISYTRAIFNYMMFMIYSS